MDLSPLILSINISIISTIICFVLGIFCAYFVVNMKKYSGIVDAILMFPMILPPTVIGFLLLLLFGRNSFIGGFLMSINISIIFTPIAAVIATSIVAFPLMYRTLRGAIEQINPNILDACKVFGVSKTKVLLRVIVPNIVPSIFAGCILCFARSLGEFGATAMVSGNIIGKTQTISMAIYQAVQAGQSHYDEAIFWTIIISVISFIFIIILNLWHIFYAKKH